jgi:hypothetical protein
MLLICGCAAWQLVQSPYQWKNSGFEATLPAGWMKFNSPADLLFLTKDGELLQNIRIYRYEIDKKDTLPISKKTFTDTMLPQEISELIVNEMSLDETKQKLSIIENIPVDISGEDGFKIEYTFNTRESLRVKTIMYGFKKDKFIYLIQYQSAEQYYFTKDLTAFKDFVNSFKVLK